MRRSDLMPGARLTGCGPPSQASATKAVKEYAMERSSVQGLFRVSYRSDPAPVPVGKPNR